MTDNYTPYGIEWEKELMKLPKKFLIDMLRKAFTQSTKGEDARPTEQEQDELVCELYDKVDELARDYGEYEDGEYRYGLPFYSNEKGDGKQKILDYLKQSFTITRKP